LRCSAQPHPGLTRRLESHLRRAGLRVHSRAERPDGDVTHIGFITSTTGPAEVQKAIASIQRLGRVTSLLWLGVGE
jgi:hypothetical protein